MLSCPFVLTYGQGLVFASAYGLDGSHGTHGAHGFAAVAGVESARRLLMFGLWLFRGYDVDVDGSQFAH